MLFRSNKIWNYNNISTFDDIVPNCYIKLTIKEYKEAVTVNCDGFKCTENTYEDLTKYLKQNGIIAKNRNDIRFYASHGPIWIEEDKEIDTFCSGQHIAVSVGTHRRKSIGKIKINKKNKFLSTSAKIK